MEIITKSFKVEVIIMLFKKVDKSKFVLITIILLAILVMIRAYEDSKFYDNQITIRGITFSYEKLPTKQNEAVKFRIYNDNELPINALIEFEYVEPPMTKEYYKRLAEREWIEVYDLESGKIVEAEMPESMTAYKGKYKVVVYGHLTDPDDPDSKYSFYQIIDEFEIK